MPRKPPADRRTELLRAAIAVVTRKGFAAVTVRDVANEVGVTHGLVNHYFGRDAMLAEAFDLVATEEYAEWDRSFSTTRHPMARLRELCDPPAREHYLIWMDAWSEAPRNPALLASLRRHHREWERVTARALDDGIAAGVVACEDPVRSARSILAHCDGLAVQLHSMELLTTSQYRALAQAHVERLAGLAPGTLRARRHAAGDTPAT